MSSYTSRIGQLVLQGFSHKLWPQLKGVAADQGGGDGGKIHQDFELQNTIYIKCRNEMKGEM